MDSFMEPLYSHLKAEPGEVVAFSRYNTAEHPIDILGIADAAGKCKWTPCLSLFLRSETKFEMASF